MNFRQVHLDFHTSEKIPGIGSNFSKEQFQSALKLGHVNSITVFSKCHHGWAYHPSEANEMHPGLDFDLLGAQIEAAHEIGVQPFLPSGRITSAHPFSPFAPLVTDGVVFFPSVNATLRRLPMDRSDRRSDFTDGLLYTPLWWDVHIYLGAALYSLICSGVISTSPRLVHHAVYGSGVTTCLQYPSSPTISTMVPISDWVSSADS